MGGSFNRKAAAIYSMSIVSALTAAFRIHYIFDHDTRKF